MITVYFLAMRYGDYGDMLELLMVAKWRRRAVAMANCAVIGTHCTRKEQPMCATHLNRAGSIPVIVTILLIFTSGGIL